MRARFPFDEEERLKALHRLKILDTAPELSYDDITQIATEIAGTPMAAISLVDRDRQWFKSRVGLEVQETSREVSFCAHAILNPAEILVVPDATQDQRFADNEVVVAENGVRFYAGAPVLASGGAALGALCVIDTMPRTLSARQQAALQALSRQVSRLFELHEALSEVRILQGLLPICANCKRIKTEADEWQQMEQYITDQSEATFSHGICPYCIEQLYPDYHRS